MSSFSLQKQLLRSGCLSPRKFLHQSISLASRFQLGVRPIMVFSDGINASGLTPEQSKKLETRPARDDEHLIIRDYRNGEKFKTVNSLLTLERDPQGKVIRHIEEWNHEKVVDKSDGVWGSLNEWRKRMTADLIGKSVTDDPKNL